MQRKHIKSVYHNALPFAVMSLLVAVFFFRLFYPSSSIFMIPDFDLSDVLHMNLPFKYVLSESLKRNEWPLWEKGIGSGFPLLAEGQIGTFYLPNLLFFKYLDVVTAYNLNLVLSYWVAAIGMFLFVRALSFHPLAATVASIIFTFSGFFSVHLNHFNLIQAASLTPLLFWATLRLTKNPSVKNSFLHGFLLSQQIFSGQPQIVLITVFGNFFLLLFTGKKLLLKTLSLFFLAIGLGACLSAIQLFPSIELLKTSQRHEGLAFEEVTAFPYPPKHFLSWINPFYFGDPGKGTYPSFSSDWGIFWENTAYVGILPLVLMGISLFTPFTNRRIFVSLLIISLLLILGKYSPLYFVFSLPPFSFFRVPSRFLLLAIFTIAVLASSTLHVFFHRLGLRNSLLVFITFALITGLILSDEFKFSYNYPPVFYSSEIMTAPETALFLSQKKGAGNILSVSAPWDWNDVFLRSGWQEKEAFLVLKNSLYQNSNLLWAIPQSQVYTGGLKPKRIAVVSELLQNPPATFSSFSKNLLAISGVTHLVTSQNLADPTVKKVYETPANNTAVKQYKVYAYEKALPFAYIAYRRQKIATVEEFFGLLSNSIETNTVFTEEDFSLSDMNPVIQPQYLDWKEKTTLMGTVSADASGLLVINQSFYPGWQARINGRRQKIYPVNINSQAILLEKGIHSIEISYQPKSFEIGKWLTVTTAVISFLVVFLSCAVFPQIKKHTELLS